MSMIYCDRHNVFFDTDTDESCMYCENEYLENIELKGGVING